MRQINTVHEGSEDWTTVLLRSEDASVNHNEHLLQVVAENFRSASIRGKDVPKSPVLQFSGLESNHATTQRERRRSSSAVAMSVESG